MSSFRYIKNSRPRNSGMFKPGVSGNPAGRPKKDYRLSELARDHTPEAIKVLIDIATSSKHNGNDRVRAASILLDRAYGKAT